MKDLNQLNELMGLLAAAKWAVILYVLSYVLRAFGLSLLGAQSKQRSTWTAWLPVLNNYLVCRLGKTSPALMLPALIPFLNLLVDAYLGLRMAKAANKSAVLGLLYGVPLFGNAVPLLLGFGAAAAEEKKDESAQTPLVSALIHAGVVCSVVLALGLTAFALGRMTLAKAPPSAQQVAAALPKRVAGTLTEFPIDSAAAKPAKPSGVVTQFFGSEEKPSANERITKEKLPPWMAPDALPAAARSAIAAEYTTGEGNVSVNVVTLDLRGQSSEALARPSQEKLAEFAPGATVSGVDLKSARNESYRGYRVTSPEASYYALQKTGTNTAVLISAANAASKEVAERLAANVGAGDGLLEDEGYREVFASVPPPPDDTAQMMEMQTVTEADVARYMAVIDQAAASAEVQKEIPNELKALYPLVRQVVPRSITFSAYQAADRDVAYMTATANFPSGAKAWTALQTIESIKPMALQFIPADAPFDYTLENQDIAGASGLVFNGRGKNGEDGTVSAVLMRRGASLVVMVVISKASLSVDVRPWAEKFAAAN
jgi:hypothetical protein